MTLNIVDDTETETTETVIVTLGAPINASLGATTVETVSIIDNEKNTAPTIPAGQTLSVPENSPLAPGVGTVIANDSDTVAAFNTVKFSLSSNPNGAFAINQTTGQVTVANPAALDFESNSSLIIGVTATDGGNLSAVQSVTVTLTNVNDAPVVTGGPFQITENSPVDALVGKISATDQDAGQTRTFAISGGDTTGAFAISATGEITVAKPNLLNFEITPQFTLTVTVTAANVQDVLRLVTFKSTSTTAGNRSIQMKITNIGGLDTNLASREIQLVK